MVYLGTKASMSSSLILTGLDTVGWSKDLVDASREMPTGRSFCIFVMAIADASFFMKSANHWRLCAPHTDRPCLLPKGFERKPRSAQGCPDLALWRHSSAWESDSHSMAQWWRE